MAAPSLSGVQAGGDYTVSGNNKAATSASMTTTTGRGLVAFVVWQDNSASPTLTDSKSNGAWTPGTLRTWTQYSTTVYMQQFLLPAMATAGASHTVTAAHAAGADSFPTMFVMEVVNPGGTLGIDTESFTTDSSSPYAATLTSVASDVLMLCETSPSNTNPTLPYTGTATGWTNPYAKAGTGLWNLAAFAKTVSTPAATPISATYSVAQDAELHGMAIMGVKATSTDVTLALTGAGATASPGTVANSFSRALTGQGRTSAPGAVVQSRTMALTGSALTSAPGIVTASTGSDVTVALAGAQADSAPGTVAPDTALGMSGTGAQSVAGTVAPAAAVGLTGTGAQGDAGVVTPSATGADVTVAISGAETTTQAGDVGASGGGTPTPATDTGGTGGADPAESRRPLPQSTQGLQIVRTRRAHAAPPVLDEVPEIQTPATPPAAKVEPRPAMAEALGRIREQMAQAAQAERDAALAAQALAAQVEQEAQAAELLAVALEQQRRQADDELALMLLLAD